MAAVIKDYETDSTGFYSGGVKSNWDAVYQQAYAIAKENIFKMVKAEPDAASVIVDQFHEDQPVRGNRMSYKWTGGHTEDITGAHEHTDKDWRGHFKNWQGNRNYHWNFKVKATPMN